jgi:16S rRNA (adenine1518-N6/adenine1519-N6)-dimethyltransferase
MPAGSSRPTDAAPELPRPRKRLGQSFLRDRSVLARILAAGDLSPRDEVLEIGPGRGILTEALAGAAGKVVAVELDDALVVLLRERFAAVSNVEIVPGNALDLDPCRYFDGPYKLIANIPYYITGPILRHYLEASCPPSLLVLMLQREVAERITAAPGALSLLGVSVQRYTQPAIVSRVPAGAFRPRPKVDSAIVRLVPKPDRRWLASRDAFFTVARAGFGLRRKQLANALAHGLSLDRAQVLDLLSTAGIDATRRAETLTLDEWDRLAATWAARPEAV